MKMDFDEKEKSFKSAEGQICEIVFIDRDVSLSEKRPYANEHACRLNEPGQYDRFARKNCEIKHNGKCVDVIYGIKKGKSEIQAYRYPKKTWDADDARAHCKSHDGKFEAAAEEKGMEEETIRKIKIGKQYRNFTIDTREIDEKKRTVPLSFSSEEPVERWWGVEILDHEKKSVNLRRLKRGGALLIDHDMRNQVGVIEEVSIDEADRKGRASVRFGRSAKAEEIFQDVLDGIRSNVSVGYQIEEVVLEKEEKNKPSTYRVSRWEPYEISLVAVPADINVGVGRADEDGKEIEIRIPAKDERTIENKTSGIQIPKKEERKMEKCTKCGANMVEGKCPTCEAAAVRSAAPPPPVAAANAVEMEKERKRGIENLCNINKIPDNIRDAWISQGLSMVEVSDQLLLVLEERGRNNPQAMGSIGLTRRETESFSLVKAILACIDSDWRNAPFELDCSRAVAKKLNKVVENTKFYVPFEVLERKVEVPVHREGRRDLSVAYGGGAYLVDTTNIGFIEMLRNRAVVFKMGARRLSGLQGNVTIPKHSGAATAYWLTSETTELDESQQTILQVVLTPKTVGAYTEVSRQLLLQSTPGAEGIVSDDLAQVVAIGADYAALTGNGLAGKPLGIISTPLIGGVTGTSLGYAGILEFQTDVAGSNVTPIRGGYVTTPTVAGLMMAEMKAANTYSPVWDGNIWDGMMCGFPSMSSNQMPSATMIFGDWQEMVVGEWGVLEVEVNPYANFKAGIVGIRALYSMDCGLRRPVAFSYAHTIT
jgi:HK97 family phage major capsid protein/HK97 family phage prohead protease